jgi:hypothetical protein
MTRLSYAFRQGLQVTLRNAQWLVLFYVVSLVISLLQNWPLLAAGSSVLNNPLAEQLARGDLDAVVDLFLTRLESLAYVGVWALVGLVLVPIYGLLYNFWSGGIVSIAAGRRRFWPGGRHTFWSFTALGLMIMLLIGIAAAIGVLVEGLLGWNSLVLVAVLVALTNTLGEYARAAAAVNDRQNPFVLLGQATMFCLRHLPGVLVLSLAGFVLYAGLFAAYGWAVDQVTGSFVQVALQQISAFLFIGIKALRLMWATTYMRGIYVRQAAEGISG